MRDATVILIATLMFAHCPSVLGDGTKEARQERTADRPVSPAPTGWPQQWGERKLHRYEHAFIYAQKKSAADEVLKTLRTVIEDAQQEGVTEPADGLMVVIDVEEKFPIDIARLEEVLKDPNAPTAGEESKEILNVIREARKVSDRAGTDVNSLVAMLPIPLRPAALPKIAKELPGGPDPETAWCIIVPTDRYARAAMKATMDAIIKIGDMNWKERLLIGAFTPVAKHVAGEKIRKTAQADLYRFLVEGQKDFSEEVKKEKVNAYRQKLGLDAEPKPKADQDRTTADQEKGAGSR